MAALIGDLAPDLSRFHDICAKSSQIQSQHHHQSTAQRQRSPSRPHPHASPHHRSSSRPRPHASAAQSDRHNSLDGSAGHRRIPSGSATCASPGKESTRKAALAHTPSTEGTSSKFPSPPPSSSPHKACDIPPADDAKDASMAPQTRDIVSATQPPLRNDAGSSHPVRRNQEPSPPSSQSFQMNDSSIASSSITNPDSNSTPQTSQEPPQTVVYVRDLAHMQSLVDAKLLGGSGPMSSDSAILMKYEISGMPIADIIEMVAALLTKITTTNDLQHDAMQRNVTHQQQANQSNESSSHMSPLSHSVLAFHGRNVPAITILSYLSRIHKYCPTTYEVFLSLLVYFDRMTERVNEMVRSSERARGRATSLSKPSPPREKDGDVVMCGDAQESIETDSDLADDDDGNEVVESPTGAVGHNGSGGGKSISEDLTSALSLATYFVVDGFNIHRLIISGVTCASKFFSDVFYTNSRYAKVGGLPLAELNHLEIQFLVLNDFRLAVPVEDLEAYATMLVEFYAREVLSQKSPAGT